MTEPPPPVPSPKSQEYVKGSPSGSVEPVASKSTVNGSSPDSGLPAATAVGPLLTGGAAPVVLLRRATMDLAGLAPRPEHMRESLGGASEDAFEDSVAAAERAERGAGDPQSDTASADEDEEEDAATYRPSETRIEIRFVGGCCTSMRQEGFILSNRPMAAVTAFHGRRPGGSSHFPLKVGRWTKARLRRSW